MSKYDLIAVDKNTIAQLKATAHDLDQSFDYYLNELFQSSLRADLESDDDCDLKEVDQSVAGVHVLYLGQPPYNSTLMG